MVLLYITIFSMLGSLGALAASGIFLLLPDATRTMLLPALVSYATGTLLGAAFLGMIPTALEEATATAVSTTVLAGLVLFFVLEKLVLWRHCHDNQCATHSQAGPLLLFGDALHNFVDGVVIAAAFLVSPALGIATALAVIAHEIPQEVGDFAILLESGYSRARALVLNGISSLATLPGALITYLWLEQTRGLVPYILALSAASFMYIAIADLIPNLHRQTSLGASVRQITLLCAGIGTIALFRLMG
jgi:zinc and cadmium transporter